MIVLTILKGCKMKKILWVVLISMLFTGNVLAIDDMATAKIVKKESIKLPEPQKNIGKPLMEALSLRRTVRHFSDQPMDLQTLSNLLWATFGINDEEGKRTIPTAKNTQNLRLYVLLESGSYVYSAKNNMLVAISVDDIRGRSGAYPEELRYAAVVLVYVEAKNDKYNFFNTGAASQNAGLFAASEGLHAWIISSFYDDILREALNINENEEIKVIQAIGK